jgi:hypothetical protein
MWSSSLICGLILLPREIRVVPPPWNICLRIWPTGLLSKIIESVHLFHLKKTVIDGQFCAWCMGLAQTEQLSTGNVFATLRGFPTLRASSLLTMASILWVNFDFRLHYVPGTPGICLLTIRSPSATYIGFYLLYLIFHL